MPTDDARDIRRLLGRALVVALCVATLTAIAALLTGSFSNMDWRVIGTSMAFATYSALAASGAAVVATARPLGRATVGAASLGFALAVLLLWQLLVEDVDDWAPRAWGVVTIVAFTLSHAAIVTRSRRPDDSDAIRALVRASTVLGAIDGFVGALLVTGVVDAELSGFGTRLLAAALVLLVATSVLPPIMRRVASVPAPAAQPSLAALPRAVIEATERIERHALPPAVRDECRRLRELARSAGG